MIELRADGSAPGPDTVGRVYKIIDQITGKVGFNLTGSDREEELRIAQIEAYDSFGGWMTDVVDIAIVHAECRRLNADKHPSVDTPHTMLVKRIRVRLNEHNRDTIDGHDILSDLAELVKDIKGRRIRPALPGWEQF